VEVFVISAYVILSIQYKKENLPYGTLGPEGLIEYDIAALYDIVDIL